MYHNQELLMTVKLRDIQTKLLSFHLSFLTWLSKDVGVSYCHSSCEVVPSVLSFKLPRNELGLLGLKHNKQTKSKH